MYKHVQKKENETEENSTKAGKVSKRAKLKGGK